MQKLFPFTEENEVRTMVDPNSRSDPKLQELMKVRRNEESFGRCPQTYSVEAPYRGHYKKDTVLLQRNLESQN